MKTRYFTNGSLDDASGSGVTITVVTEDDDGNMVMGQRSTDGKPYYGYKPKEISEEEAKIWFTRIAKPDMVDYFPNAFGRGGVVDKATFEANNARLDATKSAELRHQRATRSVKRVQALIALNKRNITKPDIYAVIGALPAAQQAEALLWFEESLTFVRNHPYINAIGAALKLSKSDLDDLFDEAEVIN